MTTIRTEANFLADTDHIPDDFEIAPGVTAAAARKAMRRPEQDPPGSTFLPSITYSATAGDIGQMALYRRTDTREQAPMVLFIHGGGWEGGHHYGDIRYTHRLAALGYVAAAATYRLRPEAPWPAAIEDTKCAIRWLRRHASEIGGDPDRIVIAGGSAGGHLAALTALTPGVYEGAGGWSDVSSAVQGAVLFCPAVDLHSMAGRDPELARIIGYFGDDLDGASPLKQAAAPCPPILSMSGDADPLVDIDEVRRFHAALTAAGVVNRLEVFEGADHGVDFRPENFKRALGLLKEFLAETVGVPHA